ncbi:M23 family metallopeptidase [Mucilaginibacter sp. HMF5004]|nr:M23 family metallopeptidase [Mucilaginibacter rivuli]
MAYKLKTTLLLFLVIICFSLHAQDIIQTRQYPKDFFRYPLDLPPTTAGSFGELRANHFHAGLDFKTNQAIGIPLHAVADGYVSRLKVQFGGFGNAVYITHPNGYTSVYGHLSRFAPGLAKIIRDTQYKQQSFEVDINLQPMQIPVCKDQVFAWSGNAGASAGPHLHFEMRDVNTQETINPQLFGLTIRDKVPPAITSLYVYHLNGEPFSELTPKEYHQVAGSNGKYHLAPAPVLALNGQIGFGIGAYDMNSTSMNHNGVYSIRLSVDGKPVFTFAVEDFAFDQTHAINAIIDYPLHLTTGREIQKSFILPGNKITVFPQSVNRGLISFTDDDVHEVAYEVKDVAGNMATLAFKVKSSSKPPVIMPKPAGTLFKYNQRNEFNAPGIKVVVQPGNLYDDLNFIYSASAMRPGAYSVVHHVHNRFTPIHDTYELSIKPDAPLGANAGKAVIYNLAGGSEGGTFDGEYVKTNARGFGNFEIRIDTIPPRLTPLNIHDGANLSAVKTIHFQVSDNLSGLKTYNGKIDGKWVLVEWDYKTRLLNYTFDENITPGKHVFDLVVGDNKSNFTQYTANFYR